MRVLEVILILLSAVSLAVARSIDDRGVVKRGSNYWCAGPDCDEGKLKVVPIKGECDHPGCPVLILDKQKMRQCDDCAASSEPWDFKLFCDEHTPPRPSLGTVEGRSLSASPPARYRDRFYDDLARMDRARDDACRLLPLLLPKDPAVLKRGIPPSPAETPPSPAEKTIEEGSECTAPDCDEGVLHLEDIEGECDEEDCGAIIKVKRRGFTCNKCHDMPKLWDVHVFCDEHTKRIQPRDTAETCLETPFSPGRDRDRFYADVARMEEAGCDACRLLHQVDAEDADMVD